MAHQEEVNNETSLDFTFDELQKIFTKLLIEFNKVRLTNKELKKQNFSLSHEREKIFEKLNSLACENHERRVPYKPIASML